MNEVILGYASHLDHIITAISHECFCSCLYLYVNSENLVTVSYSQVRELNLL